MRCASASTLIQLYIDKQLSLDQIRTLEQHLASCTGCRKDLAFYEEVDRSLARLELVAEPVDLTMNVMQRVAWSTRQEREARARRQERIRTFRPSWQELLAAISLATVTMLGAIISEPSLRAVLPIANGSDPLSLFFISLWNSFLGLNGDTLMLAFWVVGTLLGIWITLIVAGSEVRHTWFRAVMDRLPVW